MRKNTDPSMPWNDPAFRDNPSELWNDQTYRDDPLAPWNDPGAGRSDYERYKRDKRGGWKI